MSIKRKATYNAIWLSLGSLTELIFGYFYIVILSRQLGADGLGQYYYILAIVTTITLVMNLNPPEILIKSIARQSDFVSRDMGYYLVIRFFLSILSVALILTMVFLSSRSAPFKWALIFSIPYAVTLIYGHLLEAVAKAHQDVLHLTLSRIVERLLAVGLLLVVAAAGRVSINLCILIVVFSSLIQTRGEMETQSKSNTLGCL